MKKALALMFLGMFLALRPAPAVAQLIPDSPPSLIQILDAAPPTTDKDDGLKLECPKGAKVCAFSYRFQGRLDDDSTEKLQKFVAAAEKAGGKAIMLEINSPGGDYDDVQEVVRTMEMSHIRFACVVDGEASSGAFAFLQSCDVRFMTKRSYLMTHNVLLKRSSEEHVLHIYEAQAKVDEMRVLSDAFAEQCMRHGKNITMEQYRANIAHGNWMMSWKEAEHFGFVDRALDTTPNYVYKALLDNAPLKSLR